MRYCQKCKRLFKDADEFCPDCHKNTKAVTDINEPVRLAVAGSSALSMLEGALSDADIPYYKQNSVSKGVGNDIVTGYDVKLSNISVLVPYSATVKALGIVGDFEGVDESLADCVDAIQNDIEKYKKENANLNAPMSRTKRTTIKVITAIAFLALIAAAVFSTDYIISIIKKLFGG